MFRHTHWHVGHNQRGCHPESAPLCCDDPEDAVRVLGEAIEEWADFEHDKPQDERDADAGFAAGLAEIFTNGRAAEFGDEVTRVRQQGTGYIFGGRVYWAVPLSLFGRREELRTRQRRGRGKVMIRTANKDARDLIAARREFQGSNFTGRIERYPFSLGRLEGPERDRYLAACRSQADAGRAMYVVYSYATPIAWTPTDGPADWIVTQTRYSVTTSKHLHIVRGALALAGIPSTPPGWTELVAEAERLGRQAGQNAGAWHAQHIDSSHAAWEILDGLESGDITILDALPACSLDDEDLAAILDAARGLQVTAPCEALADDSVLVWDAYRAAWDEGAERAVTAHCRYQAADEISAAC